MGWTRTRLHTACWPGSTVEMRAVSEGAAMQMSRALAYIVWRKLPGDDGKVLQSAAEIVGRRARGGLGANVPVQAVAVYAWNKNRSRREEGRGWHITHQL